MRKGSKEKDKDKKHLDYGCFKMKIGDKYTGYYYKKPNGDIFRHGRGVYETRDGEIYDGVWAMDDLVSTETVKISYNDGCAYEGGLQNYYYEGFGIYTFSNNRAKMQCVYKKNKPLSKVQLIDPNGCKWIGNVNDRGCFLRLRNIFYDSIPTTLGLPSYQPTFGIKNSDDNDFDNITNYQSHLSLK